MPLRQSLRIVTLLPLLAGTSLLSAADKPLPDGAGLDFFEKRIRPVLVEHCYECHAAGQKRQGGLLLDTRAGIRRGGDSGEAVVPGKPQDSLLLAALRYDSFEMPPKGQLPKDVIADFEKWIRIGAPDPREGSDDSTGPSVEDMLEQGRSFWSFKPVKRPDLPVVSDAGWEQTPVDRFVQAKLDQAGLKPLGPANKLALLRRVYFDLVGLPPTPEQIDAFLRDDDPQALERLVDELLKSPEFGERWGRHWLDVVRFSESSGGGRTRVFEEAWRYRDYVIDAFNSGKPFDRFIREQLAGDLLDADTLDEQRANLAATSLLSIGPINYELQDKNLLDMEVVDEQLDVINKAFLGMTIGCARCHDHKFDPIPSRDYYALAGIFTSTKTLNHANVSNPVMRDLPVDEDTQQQLAAYAAKVDPLTAQISDVEKSIKRLEGKDSGSAMNIVPIAALAGSVIDETRAQLVGAWSPSTSVKGFVGDGYHHSSESDAQAIFEFKIDQPGRYEVRLSYTAASNRASNASVTIWHPDGDGTVTVNMQKAPPLDSHFVSLGSFDFSETLRVILQCRDADGVVIADAVQLLPAAADGEVVSSFVGRPKTAGSDPQEATAANQKLADLKGELAELNQRLKRLQKNSPPALPAVMSVEEGDSPDDCSICIRGNVHNRGPKVPRGFLSIMTGGKPAAIPDGASGRRELADWIASPDNTLTARVAANRIWYWLMGNGIVRSVDNFGTTGELPTHPELLDWLASEFVDHDWSVRHLIRQIVLSKTYQLANQSDPDALRVDPENRLLAYAPRRRLDAECIRDAILSVSGQLDLTPGGSTIRPGTKSEFGYEFNSEEFDGRRRSVYVPVFRNTLLDVFEVFDFADPNLPMGRRAVSTLPTQGLYFLNSPWIYQQSGFAAERLHQNNEITETERIDRAHLLFLGRLPTPAERSLAEELLSEAGSEPAARTKAWTLICQSLFASLDFRYLR